MTGLSRVICAAAIDDRDSHVFAHALALARRNDANLLVLHAASPEVAFNHGATERVDFLRRLHALAEAAGVDVRVTVQRGPVAEIVLLHARARKADLIVLGTGRKETRRGLSGWIAEQVLRDAPCPTLVIPHGTDAPTLWERVLCAVDFSPASQAAIREAARLANYSKQPVTLLHVVEGLGSGALTNFSGIASQEFRRRVGGDALAKLQSVIPHSEGTAVARVTVGRPVTDIMRTARKTKAQLIVIGAAPRRKLGRSLFGITGQLLRDAKCPVLAVPVGDPAEARTGDVKKVAA